MLSAAFVNAASGNVFDFDDTHHPTIIHPTAPVAPALFALAESQPVSGAALLHAFVLGVEVECRLGNAVTPWHYRRGWHITSTCGVFGAAAAVAKLLAFDAGHVIWALGNASAQSSGLVETLGTMAKSIGVGAAARGGLGAALFAQAGVTGPAEPIAGPRGFASVMGDGANLDAITQGLGETWELMANTHKPYPCGVVLFPVIDACLELRARHPDVRPDAIADIAVEGHPLLRERADRPSVSTGREAQVSAQHSVAATLIHGVAGVAQFEDACVNSPDILTLRRRVKVVDRANTPVEAAHVTITLADGRDTDGLRGAGPRHAAAPDVGCRHRGEGPRAGAPWLSGPRSFAADRCGLVARPRHGCGRDRPACRRLTHVHRAGGQMRADHRIERRARLRNRAGACRRPDATSCSTASCRSRKASRRATRSRAVPAPR